MYPAEIVIPMKAELIQVGFKELLNAAAVDSALSAEGTSMVVLNSAGEHVSIGGDFVLDGDDVFPDGSQTDPVLIDASALRVDLQ